MKNLVILGSTGSIGTQTLEIVSDKKEDFKVLALAAYSNVSLIESQIRAYNPKYAILYKEDAAKELALKVVDLPVKVLSGLDGLIQISV